MRNRILEAVELPRVTFNEPRRSNKMFIKRELRPNDKMNPRVINAVDARYALVFGPWLSAIATRIKALGLRGYGYFLSPDQLLDFFQADGFRYFDFHRFDCRLRREHFLVEQTLYEAFGMPRALRRAIFKYNLDWSGRARSDNFFFDFRVKGYCRQTGDPHTSAGNNHIAIFSHVFCFLERYRRDHSLPPQWYEDAPWVPSLEWITLLNNGDDAAIKSTLPFPGPDLYAELGMTITEGNSYCKLFQIWDGVRFLLAREPYDFLVRFSFAVRRLPTNIARAAALRGNCIGFSYLVSGLPVYSALVTACERLTRFVVPDYSCMSSHTLAQLLENTDLPSFRFQPPAPPTPVARTSFASVFEFPIWVQLEAEAAFAAMSSYDECITCHALQLWLDINAPHEEVKAGDL